jgi:hypothetical protein
VSLAAPGSAEIPGALDGTGHDDDVRGPSVRWRSGGHQLHTDTDILRFEVVDLNRVIANAAASANLYRGLQDRQGHRPGWQVLPLSCFAVTAEWPPARLAENTGFRSYRLCRAGVLTAAGYELWPTEVFIDDVPDPRNDVHYDLIVAAGPCLIPDHLISGDKATRRAARAQLAPRFEAVLARLGDPDSLG